MLRVVRYVLRLFFFFVIKKMTIPPLLRIFFKVFFFKTKSVDDCVIR